jgi:hypothetical protein
MCIFPIGIEFPHHVPIQRLHETNSREHWWPVVLRHQKQRFRRGLPFRQARFVFR